MSSLSGFTLAVLENIRRKNSLELRQGNVAIGLDVEKLMHKAWPHMIKLHEPTNKEEI
jgi:hypothetical protein